MRNILLNCVAFDTSVHFYSSAAPIQIEKNANLRVEEADIVMRGEGATTEMIAAETIVTGTGGVADLGSATAAATANGLESGSQRPSPNQRQRKNAKQGLRRKRSKTSPKTSARCL